MEKCCEMNAASSEDEVVIDLSSLKGAIEEAENTNVIPTILNRSAMWARKRGRKLEFGEMRRALVGTQTKVFGNEHGKLAEDANQILSR